jgi:hypothetical protein
VTRVKSELRMREKIALLLLLLYVAAVTVSGHAIRGKDAGDGGQSEPSCSDEAKNDLVCSEEVLAAIKREEQGLPPLPPKAPVKPERPATSEQPEAGTGDDGLYYDDEYYDE